MTKGRGQGTGDRGQGHVRPVLLGATALAGLGLLALLATAGARAHLEAPAATLLLRDRNGEYLCEIPGAEAGELGYWPVAAPPPRVAAATVALEDRRFFAHPGVDPLAVGRAFLQNLRSGHRVSGASTLAMQIARMQKPESRTLLHKLVEATTAVLLTARYGRDAILAHYLRIAPYGNRIHGIAYAARRYLDKPVEDLSWAEIAYLSALPQAPGRMNPYQASGRQRAIARGRRLLALLRDAAVLSPAEYELASSQIGSLAMPERETRPVEALHLIMRLSRELRAKPPRSAGPLLRTSLDLDLQRRAAGMLVDAVEAWEAQGAGNAALMVVDRRTREVLACVGSTGFFDNGRRGAIDYARVPRSPGSTLKPFLYALALDLGVITPATILDDLQRAPGGIVNADEDFLGPLLPRVALANSRNVPAVDLLARLGVREGFAFFRDLGLHDGRESARFYGLGLAVGGMPVSLEHLVRAYTVLAGDGALGELVWLPDEPRARPARLLSEAAVRQVSLFLSDPLARLPTFPRMGATEYPMPVAVKTGTSPEMRDAWTMAYSSRYLVGVWVGRPDFRPMSGLTGYACAAQLARRVLSALHPHQQDGMEDVPFPPPAGYRSVRVCALTGKRASPLCDRVFTEWFRPGSEPAEECDVHLRLVVDRRTGALASRRTPERDREESTFTMLPPRYAAWAAGHGYPHAGRPLALADTTAAVLAAGGRIEPAIPAARPTSPPRVRLHVASPRNNSRLLRDPETPTELSSVALQAIVDPPVRQVVWYVDGVPYSVVDYPYTTRWPLTSGEHTFQVRVPFTHTASSPVRVSVE